MSTTNLVIYHGNCQDGFGAAYAAWKEFGERAEYFPGVYGETPPDVEGRNVYLLDFSYKRDVLIEMARKTKSLTIIDHHVTAEADLKGLDQLIDITLIFNMRRSGATLAWEFFDTKSIPSLFLHIEDRDLWTFKLPHTREISAALFSHPYDFELWSELIKVFQSPAGRQQMIAEGRAINRAHIKNIEELVKVMKRPMTIGGVRVPVANLPYTMASDAAHLMADGVAFAACYFDRADGQRVFSLRSHDDGVDVALVAKQYGGGGHKHAAGFQRPIGWEGDETPAYVGQGNSVGKDALQLGAEARRAGIVR